MFLNILQGIDDLFFPRMIDHVSNWKLPNLARIVKEIWSLPLWWILIVVILIFSLYYYLTYCLHSICFTYSNLHTGPLWKGSWIDVTFFQGNSQIKCNIIGSDDLFFPRMIDHVSNWKLPNLARIVKQIWSLPIHLLHAYWIYYIMYAYYTLYMRGECMR